MIGLVLVLIFFLLPLVVGILLVGLSRRGLGYPACGGCMYDLSGSIGVATRCPECGEDFANVGIVPPKGRRNRIMVWTGVVLIVLALWCAGVYVAFSLSGRQQRAAFQSAAQQGPVAVAGQQPASQPAATPSAAETQQDEDG